jgi:translation initiation factor 5A
LEITRASLKELKPGGFIIIEDAPCKIEKITFSTSGKHGAAKARVEAIGLLDNRRRSIVKPSGEDVEVPIILKKQAQVLAIVGEKAQIMDLTTYENFELDIPEDLKGTIQAGSEIFYFEVAGVKTLKKLK